MFWLEFSWSDGRVKIDHSPKRTYAGTGLSKYIMGPVPISKPCFEYMVQCEFHDVMAHITECVSNVKWAQKCVFLDAHLKCFDPVCWILLGKPHVKLQSFKLLFSFYFKHTYIYMLVERILFTLGIKLFKQRLLQKSFLIYLLPILPYEFMKYQRGDWHMAGNSQNCPNVHFSQEISQMHS